MDRLLELIKYIFVGILQGISEILPISSSGHLIVFQDIFNINTNNSVTFTILLHFASLCALLIYFRKTLIDLIKGTFLFVFKKDNQQKEKFLLMLYIIIASVPVGIIGILFEDKIESVFSNLLFVGINFIFTSALLFVISNIKNKNEHNVTLKSAIITGLFQVISIFPGISRSGATISGARISGLEENKAKNFSFLLFIPVALGSFIFSLDDASKMLLESKNTLILSVISMCFTFVFTYLSLLFVLKKFTNKHYKYFSLYLFLLGLATIFYF